LQVLNGSLKVLLTRNVPTNKLPLESSITNLANQSGTFIPNSSLNDEWLRLILPLKIGDNFIGFWLLGRRDPDDVYPLAEIPILQSLANQTAITLSNILQTEQLRQMYQLDIERNELERKRLALDLHDSVLNELAVLRANLDEINLSAQFKASYAEVTQRLREIVSDLLPPMLMYGLVPAMVELADNLMERSDDAVNIAVDVQSSEGRPAQYIEQHIFRIVQEAWENVLKHANAKSINVHGLITGSAIDLTIEDNGKGFDMDDRFDLASLLSNNHFGLAGMVERAHLIEAEITIQSKIETGTTIQIRWIKSV
jgi:two-component system sensor histidine kinase DegS